MIISNLKYHDVPNYDEFSFKPKEHNFCVVLFVINEGNKLISQLDRMLNVDLKADVIIADGGSSDGSTEHNVLISKGVNTLLVKQDTGKLGSQMRMAYAWALERGYEGVVVIDGNNKDSVGDIPNFVKKLVEGYDHVQGSRFIPGGKAINTPKSRLLGLKLLHVPVMRIASGFKYTDTTNGFRAYSKKLLLSDNIALFRSVFTGYELHYYLAIEAAKQGFNCIEIPVSRQYPKTGKTPTKISPIKGNLNVIVKLFSCAFSKYKVK
ncbi:glycosyl transferase family 2 [Photobacterium leiognathi subsp. mandapamensis]|uniref:glycosyltransferase family 2 protein n=1 Tax=Photobacterium leiognathi TaxID=553611 RepID=UPI000D152409|nr:glycosyltransferase family 2 protein [Photobacterium leiognathi]PSW65246.1 glycosyl transferase family 2 [Photobacterium leiognathi subsp. mandapamensis]